MYFTAINYQFGPGPTSTSTVTLRLPPPPVLDLNGDVPGDGYATTFYVGGPAVPIVDPAGFTIRTEAPTTILMAEVTLDASNAPSLYVNTYGTR